MLAEMKGNTYVNLDGKKLNVMERRKNLLYNIETKWAKLTENLDLKPFVSTCRNIEARNGLSWKNYVARYAKENIGKVQDQIDKLQPPLHATQKANFSLGYTMMGLLALCNVTYYAHEAIKAIRQDDANTVARNAIHMLPHALTLAERAFKARGKAVIAAHINLFGTLLGGVADAIDTVDLILKRDFDAAIGNGMMAGAALAWGGVGAFFALSVPVAAVLIGIFAIGFTIALACTDNEIEEYLKNGLWSTKNEMNENRADIIKSYVDCFTRYNKNKTWKKQLNEIQKYMPKFFPVSIESFIKENYLYIGICIPFPGKGRKKLMLEFRKGAGNQAVELDPDNNANLFIAFIEEQIEGLHRVEMCIDLEKLFAEYQPAQHKLTEGCYYNLPTALYVYVDYCLNDDIEYSTVISKITLSNYSPALEPVKFLQSQNNSMSESRLDVLISSAK